MTYLLSHGHIVVDGNREYLDGAILVDGDRIMEVYPQADKIGNDISNCEIIDLNGRIVMPGYFDTHTHGAIGISFDDADEKQMQDVAQEFARTGTTSFLATLSYDLNEDEYLKQLEMMETFSSNSSRFAGIHMEGPFLNGEFAGAGSEDTFIVPDVKLLDRFLKTSSRIRQMTIACELDGAKEVMSLLKEKGIKVMCGHSGAQYDDLNDDVDGFTHLFNAMKPLHHRDINLVNCAFMNRWQCEVIADGKHIDENVLKLILRNIDRDRIMIITDSSVARGMPDGEYVFLSKKCIKKDGTFINEDGHLAGSTVSINDELKLLYRMGIKYTDLLMYSSLNAFRFYGLDKRFGTIEKGKYCDLVISDDDLNIENVMVKGEFIHV